MLASEMLCQGRHQAEQVKYWLGNVVGMPQHMPEGQDSTPDSPFQSATNGHYGRRLGGGEASCKRIPAASRMQTWMDRLMSGSGLASAQML